jgi:sugar phosphate isomerase/epimerase
MPKLPIGLQLYSVREDCAKDFPAAIRQVGQMGYDGVEFAGYYDHSAQELAKILKDVGLECFGAHRPLDLMEEHFNQQVDFHMALGCDRIFVPGLPKELHDDPKGVAERIGALAEKLSAHNIMTGYHNHAWELEPPASENFWNKFAAAAPASVKLELDAGWAQAAGKDPAQVIRDHAGRIASLHAKPHSDSRREAVIGEDEVPWKDVIEAAESVGGTDYFIVEYEFGNAMTAVEKCLKALRAM